MRDRSCAQAQRHVPIFSLQQVHILTAWRLQCWLCMVNERLAGEQGLEAPVRVTHPVLDHSHTEPGLTTSRRFRIVFLYLSCSILLGLCFALFPFACNVLCELIPSVWDSMNDKYAPSDYAPADFSSLAVFLDLFKALVQLDSSRAATPSIIEAQRILRTLKA